MGSVRIALAQINTTVGDLDGNVELIVGAIERAKGHEADLVVFPELALSGYPPEGLLSEPDFVDDCRRAMDEIARRAEGIEAIVGFPAEQDGRLYDAAWFGPGREPRTNAKATLVRRGAFDESHYFAPGDVAEEAVDAGVPCVWALADDVRAGDGKVEDSLARLGSRAVLAVSADPFCAGGPSERARPLADFARRTRTFVFYCNLVGGQDELVFDGGSMILGPGGDVVARAKRFDEDMLVADLCEDRETGRVECRPVVASDAPELDRLDEIHAALVLGTRDFAGKNGFGEAALGLSGGLDSSLVAAIAVDALGGENVVGVTMPSRYSTRETVSDARRVAENLGIRLEALPIEPCFAALEGTLAPVLADDEKAVGRGVAMENLQARIRGVLLMALSNRFGWLVLAAGNRSEGSVGYCTLYGDTAGGFAPIRHVPKTLCYELARRVNERAGREVVPQSVMERPPSAELSDGQKDTDALPPYDTLDPVLEAYLDRREAFGEIVARGFDERLVREVTRMVRRSEFKRRQSPPGVMIGPRASGGWRLPITNRRR